jgi:hypothetical protein
MVGEGQSRIVKMRPCSEEQLPEAGVWKLLEVPSGLIEEGPL